MARNKKQQILNYRTSGSTNMPTSGDVAYGELIVRYNYEHPELLIKTNDSVQGQDIGDKFATFVDTKGVNNLIEAGLSTHVADISAIQSGLSALSSSVETNYITSAAVVTKFGDYATSATIYTVLGKYATSALVHSALSHYASSADTHNAIKEVNDDVSTHSAEIQAISGAVSAFSSTVKTNYITSASVVNELKNYATSATMYTVLDKYATSALVDTALSHYASSADTHNAIKEVNNIVSTHSTQIQDISGNVITINSGFSAFSGNVVEYIDDRLSTVYKYKGSVNTYESLSAITNPQNGDVYNVVAEHGTIGGDDYTPAGTNYAYVAASGTTPAHWDALGGTIDLTAYATSADTYNAIKEVNDDVSTHSAEIQAISGAVSAFSSTVETNYITSAAVVTKFGDYATSATIYTVLGKYATSALVNSALSHYASSADTHNAIKEVNNDVSTHSTQIQAISGAVSAFSSTVETNYITSAAVVTKFGDYATSATIYTVLGKYATSALVHSALSHYASSANTHNAIKEVNNKVSTNSTQIQAISGNVSALSSTVQTVQTTANNALNSFELGIIDSANASTTQSGARAMYTAGGSGKLDLSNLVIDCGEF